MISRSANWIHSVLIIAALWTALAVVVDKRVAAHPESAVRAIIQTGATLIDKESFSLFHLDATTGFSFATAKYSGAIATVGFPDVPPPNTTLTISFDNFNSGTVQPVVVRLDDDDFYAQHVEHDKFQFAINPFPASAVFDFGSKNGVKAPKNFDTGDPTLVGTIAYVSSKTKTHGFVFKLTTFARAGGAFNIIQGYVPSITAGVNIGTFHSDGHSIAITETATVSVSIPGGNTWTAKVPLTGDAKRTVKEKTGDYKISGSCDCAVVAPGASR